MKLFVLFFSVFRIKKKAKGHSFACCVVNYSLVSTLATGEVTCSYV